MTAESIAKALGGRKAGTTWMARCPAHDDRKPSLSIRTSDNGNVLVCCHAGCKQHAVIAALRACGVWESSDRSAGRSQWEVSRPLRAEPDRDALKRSDAARTIWQATTPAAGSLVECYLASRGLHLPPTPALRFHGWLRHPSGGIWPAMVALVTRGADDQPLAIHRTYLTRGGAGKAPVEPQKLMLGPCRGGAVRLAQPRDLLMVGEGIETCLAAMQATENPAWAALSTSGLRALNLPENVRDVIVLADGDDPGEAAARDCALRWKREGRRVRIARPPQGMDFNDMLANRKHHMGERVR